MPSLQPSESARPSSMPSNQSSLQPSNQPSLQPSESSRPSSIPSFQPSTSSQLSASSQLSYTPSLSIMPTIDPLESPSSIPSMKPSAVIETVTIVGSLSINQDVCSFSVTDLAGTVEATTKTISSFACSDPTNEDCSTEVTSACGSGRELRQLQSSPWQLEYQVIKTFTCKVAACTSAVDIAAVSSIADAVSSAIRNAMDSGAFLAVLSTNIILTPGLDASLFTCLSAWGTTEEPVTDVSASEGTGRFYPDWDYGSGTCLEDGNEPTHMANDASWVLGSLEECCDRYYWWDTNGCMKTSGSGLWYADVLNEVCVADCKSGGVCEGLADDSSKKLYADPRSCCESELAWRFVEFCEAESFKSECYGGSGLYYRGDSVGVNVCVKDCDPESGDKTCGGIVEESWVELHDTPEHCCAHEYSWIDKELCAARSTHSHSTLNKFWADKTKSKCEDDSVVPAEDLSTALYDSIEDCCFYGLSWLSKGACFSASGMDLTGLGSNKYYIDFVNEKCAKDCVGVAPCGGLAQQWKILYNTEDDCCADLSWIPMKDCIKA
eukprot:scaffold36305_cov35-Cyclotella_meneghiniana.AAC.8